MEAAQDLLVRLSHPFAIHDASNFPKLAFTTDSGVKFESVIVESTPYEQLIRIDIRESLKN